MRDRRRAAAAGFAAGLQRQAVQQAARLPAKSVQAMQQPQHSCCSSSAATTSKQAAPAPPRPAGGPGPAPAPGAAGGSTAGSSWGWPWPPPASALARRPRAVRGRPAPARRRQRGRGRAEGGWWVAEAERQGAAPCALLQARQPSPQACKPQQQRGGRERRPVPQQAWALSGPPAARLQAAPAPLPHGVVRGVEVTDDLLGQRQHARAAQTDERMARGRAGGAWQGAQPWTRCPSASAGTRALRSR